MSRKNETEKLEHKEVEVATIYFKNIIESILNKGRMSIEKSDTKKYPKVAADMLEGVTEEDVRKAIAEQADFTKSTTQYVEDQNEQGRPTLLSVYKTGKSLGVTRAVYLTIKEDPSANTEVKANVDLLCIKDQEPEIKVYLYASKIHFDFKRAPNDGKSLNLLIKIVNLFLKYFQSLQQDIKLDLKSLSAESNAY